MEGIKHAPLHKIKAALERDLNLSLSYSVGLNLQVDQFNIYLRSSLLQIKVVHRTHVSKVKLSRMYPDIDPCHDKCKRDEALLIHTSAVPIRKIYSYRKVGG